MSEEQAILATAQQWSRAMERKDLDAMMRNYDEKAVLFDVGGQYIGRPAIRAIWERCLPYFPEEIVSRHEYVRIVAGADVAIFTAIHRFSVPGDPDHLMSKSGTRVSVAYRKAAGRWVVVHEHASIPVDFEKGRPIPV